MADAAILAATIGSSAVALAGVGTAAWAAKQERAARGELAKSEHAYARERAHEDRVWTSRRTAYEELLGFAHRNMLAVDRTLPPGEPWGEVPGMLADEVYTTLQARVTILGTKETHEALKAFNDSVKEFFGTANRFRSREEMGQSRRRAGRRPARVSKTVPSRPGRLRAGRSDQAPAGSGSGSFAPTLAN
jgi:hypothetical protein